MTNKEILQSDMLDILFEHRNKSYGAYALRKGYNHRLAKAMGISFSVVLIFVLLNSLKNDGPKNGGGFLSDDDSLKLMTIPDKMPEKIPEEIKVKPKTQEKTVQYTDQIKIQEVVNTPPPDMTEIEKSNIGKENIDGENPTGIIKNTDPAPSGNNEGDGKKDPPVVVENLITWDAYYPGGLESFTKFLKKNLGTPGELEPGEK
jgi:protein TonB